MCGDQHLASGCKVREVGWARHSCVCLMTPVLWRSSEWELVKLKSWFVGYFRYWSWASWSWASDMIMNVWIMIFLGIWLDLHTMTLQSRPYIQPEVGKKRCESLKAWIISEIYRLKCWTFSILLKSGWRSSSVYSLQIVQLVGHRSFKNFASPWHLRTNNINFPWQDLNFDEC